MSVTEKQLKRLMKDDYLDIQERMQIWAELAEELLGEGGPIDKGVYDFLFWNKTEFYRRRKYLELEEPDSERFAAQMLRKLEEFKGWRTPG